MCNSSELLIRNLILEKSEKDGAEQSTFFQRCVAVQSQKQSFTETTEVYFRPLSEERIAWYADHFPVMDKAGAYGVQDWIGLAAVEKISGDFYNVMGLPVCALAQILESRFTVEYQEAF